MDKPVELQEPMDMPDPFFPIKVHRQYSDQFGQVLFPYHWHEHIEILFFLTGEATITCGSFSMNVRAGDVIVVNSNELHYGINQSNNLSYCALIYDLTLLHSRSPDSAETKFIAPLLQNRLLFRNKIESDPPMLACIESLINELENRDFGYELAVKSQLYSLLSMLVRGHVTSSIATEEYLGRLNNLQRFRTVFEYIEANYSNSITVDQLAQTVALSRFHFSRLFKQLTGIRIADYINNIRIRNSEHLLRSTSYTISEIAELTGFNDIYYYSRTFKKYRNVTPTDWRRSIHAE